MRSLPSRLHISSRRTRSWLELRKSGARTSSAPPSSCTGLRVLFFSGGGADGPVSEVLRVLFSRRRMRQEGACTVVDSRAAVAGSGPRGGGVGAAGASQEGRLLGRCGRFLERASPDVLQAARPSPPFGAPPCLQPRPVLGGSVVAPMPTWNPPARGCRPDGRAISGSTLLRDSA